MSDTPRASLRDALLEPRRRGWLLLALAAAILLVRIGRGALANYDDAYYAEKAREMLLSGDWVTPHFSGMLRLDNPPLYLWIVAALFRAFGVSDWAAILPSALAGVACVGLVHSLALRTGSDPFRAWCAAVVLLTTNYFLKYAGHAMFDVFLTMLFLVGLHGYRTAWEGRARGWVLLGLATGLGVLTKSVLGLFPFMVAWLHLLWCRRGRVAFGVGPAIAVGVAIATIAPWFAAQLQLNREHFLSEHLAWLLWERGFVIGRGTQTLSSRFAYVTEIAKTYWPWLPFAFVGVWMCLRRAFELPPEGGRASDWTEQSTAKLLLLWPLVVIGVMSMGIEKKLWYVMDAFPGLALLAALAIAAWVRGEAARTRTLRVSAALLAIAGGFLAFTPFFLPAVRHPDLQAVAYAARAEVPADSALFVPSGGYYSVAHQFVYYSRHRLDLPPADRAGVRAALDAGRWGLFDAAQRDTFVGADSLAYPAVVTCGRYSLVHAAPRPIVRLETSDPLE